LEETSAKVLEAVGVPFHGLIVEEVPSCGFQEGGGEWAASPLATRLFEFENSMRSWTLGMRRAKIRMDPESWSFQLDFRSRATLVRKKTTKTKNGFPLQRQPQFLDVSTNTQSSIWISLSGATLEARQSKSPGIEVAWQKQH
jgi:hypothetical protein